jgi:hypothetical protein
MSVSAVFVLDVKGRILIYRDYRGDISIKYAEKFMSKVNELEDSGKLSPVIHDDGVTYIYLQHSNVYLLAVTRDNVNATAVVLFLHRLVEVFKHYFQELEEESIRDNFVVVYELLDEVGLGGSSTCGSIPAGCDSCSSSASSPQSMSWQQQQQHVQQQQQQQWQQQQEPPEHSWATEAATAQAAAIVAAVAAQQLQPLGAYPGRDSCSSSGRPQSIAGPQQQQVHKQQP